MKVKDIIARLSEYDADEELVIAWWRRDLFTDYNPDTDDETPLGETTWNLAVDILENRKDGWGDYINAGICDEIQDAVDRAKQEQEETK